MSRRKQTKPQHCIQSEDLSCGEYTNDGHWCLDTLPITDHSIYVCTRCCAEFNSSADLQQHQTDCSQDPVVVIVSDNVNPHSYSHIFPAGSSPPSPIGEHTDMAEDFEMEDSNNLSQDKNGHVEFIYYSHRKTSHGSLDSPSSTSSQDDSGKSSGSDHVGESVFGTSTLPASFPQLDQSPELEKCSWADSNVVIENLQSTKVAVAQFSQQMNLEAYRSGSGKIGISSLVEQLLALQIQQIQQLQLIDQIRHQVLMFASQKLEIKETPSSSTQELLSSKHVGQLTVLSSHLSQQLAAAAGIAQCLANQSGKIAQFKHLTAAEQLPENHPGSGDLPSNLEPSPSVGKILTSTARKLLDKKHYMLSGTYPQLNVLSQAKISSLAFSDSFVSKTSNSSCLSQSNSTSVQTDSNSAPSISAIVEDLDALTFLAQQKDKTTKLPLFEPKTSNKDSFLKHKCRFCAKIFGSDSALQIHLRSHTGERPYKCNICGNRFSTRGNLKVHFQRHKERYPHIQMNPYPVPEHLDNIPTSTGIPYGMIMRPEKTSTCLLDSKPSLSSLTDFALLGSTSLCSLIKKENHARLIPTPCDQREHFDATAKTTGSARTGEGGSLIVNLKCEDIKPHMDFVSKKNTKLDESTNLGSGDIQSTCTESNSFKVIHPLRTSVTSKLQQLVENIDTKPSEPNECIICHRILSCQSALRMHYRTHTGERPHRCKVCCRAFSTKGNLKTHQAVHRATPPMRIQHSCPICQRKFTNAVVLQQHIRMHMDGHLPNSPLLNQKYAMSFGCGDGFMDKKKLSDPRSFSNDNTESSQKSAFSRLNSMSSSLSPSPYNNSSFDDHKKATFQGPNREPRTNWIKMERNEEANKEGFPMDHTKPALSDQCPVELSIHQELTSNYVLSPNNNNNNNKTAGFLEPHEPQVIISALKPIGTSVGPPDLKPFNHLKDAPNLLLRERSIFKNTICDICGKNFACQSALDIHYRSHTKERPFICTTCSRGFSTKGNLKQHMLTHQMRDLPSLLFEPSNPNHVSNPNPSVLSMSSPVIKTETNGFFESSFWNDRVTSSMSLNSSVSMPPVQTTVPPRRTPKQHYCHTCGKTFSSSSALQIHERTHTGEKPFACTVCGRAFTTKGNLKVHMGTHMWNSAPTRRGRRLSLDGPLALIGSRPIKLPEPPQRNSAAVMANTGESIFHWSRWRRSLHKFDHENQ